MQFSVLISSYSKDSPEELALALKSIWDDQTLKPDEIVIVKDGPLTAGLDAVLDDFARRAPVKFCPLEKNMGLGKALAIGVEACSNEYIARMDGDDIAVPDRFEKQIQFLKDHSDVSLCGGMIQEFVGSPENVTGKRILPEEHHDICCFLKRRNPFNHMTVFYRKAAALDAGNYQHVQGNEDYWLWARMIKNGVQTANLPDILVYARTGDNMLGRRRGLKLLKADIQMARNLRMIRILSMFEMIQIIVLKSLVRLLPVSILALVYKRLRKD